MVQAPEAIGHSEKLRLATLVNVQTDQSENKPETPFFAHAAQAPGLYAVTRMGKNSEEITAGRDRRPVISSVVSFSEGINREVDGRESMLVTIVTGLIANEMDPSQITVETTDYEFSRQRPQSSYTEEERNVA
jgi:hypothetical protein